MTDPKLRLALAATAGLLPGLVVGFLVAPEDAVDHATGAPTSGVERIEGPAERANDADRTSSSDGERATDPGDASPTRTETAGTVEKRGEWTLLDELKALLASGRIETMAGQDQQNVRSLLVRLYVELGDAAGALALIDSFEDLEGNERFVLLDQLLNLAFTSDPDVAALAAERALRVYIDRLDGTTAPAFGYPYDHYLGQLRSLDPHRSLELLAELRSLGLAEGIGLTLFEIEALAAAGRSDLARTMAQGLLEDPQTLIQGLDALVKVDPILGEMELRKQLEGQHGSWARGRLISMLTGQGRPLEAIDLFEEALAAGNADASLWSQLLNGVPRKYVDALLDDWLATADADFGALQSIANYFQAQGDTWATLDAYQQLWAKALESGAWLQQLPWDVIKAHPTEALALLDMAVAQVGDNDEMWGDIADTYWQAGATNEAIAAWEQASLLDPNDSEWTNKLAAAENGQSPIWTQPDSQLGDLTDLYPQQGPLTILGGGQGGYPGQSGWGESFGFGSNVYYGGESFIDFSGVSSELGVIHSVQGAVQTFGAGFPPQEIPFIEDVMMQEELQLLEQLGYADGE